MSEDHRPDHDLLIRLDEKMDHITKNQDQQWEKIDTIFSKIGKMATDIAKSTEALGGRINSTNANVGWLKWLVRGLAFEVAMGLLWIIYKFR